MITPPTGKNMFGKCSEFHMKAVNRQGRTILHDVHFTAPYKLMAPFEMKDGSIQVMLLSASAGIMAGDEQEFDFFIEPEAKVEFLSQSYEKIHKMPEGCAKRKTKVQVCQRGEFLFHPQPTIPFEGSAYASEMEVQLEDESARFAMSEILSCGRYARGECFAYRFYHNLVKIYRGGKLIYMDNTRYEPQSQGMDGIGMYESYTHLASLFLTKNMVKEDMSQQVEDLLARECEMEGGITQLASGDYVVRILGRNAQKLEKVLTTFQSYNSRPL